MALLKPQYEPGARNINEREKKSRRETGVIGLLCAIALVAFLKVAEAPAFLYITTIIPVWFFVIGFMQSFYGFCATFGLRGLQNAYRGTDDPERVMSEPARARDRKRATQLIMQAVSISLIISFVIMFTLN